jgi:hypothetical protein
MSLSEEFPRVVYRPITSVVIGGLVLVLAAILLIDTVRRGSGAGAWALGAGLVLGGLLVYVSSIRPAIVAEARHLVVRNPLRDIAIPWARVHDLRLRYQLDVHTPHEVYHAWAVPVTTRSRSAALREQRDRTDTAVRMGPSAGEYAVKHAHQPFPRQTLDELSLLLTQRRRGSSIADSIEVRWSWPYIGALAASAAGFAVALGVALLNS